jgi:signal peptidase II
MSDMAAPRWGAWVRFLGLAVGVAAADQLLKALVVRDMAVGETRRLLGSLLSLTHQSNTGAAFGMFSWASGALALAGALVVLLLVGWAVRYAADHPELIFPLALILGGALGNLLDRVFRGHVVDYLDVHFWPVFNLADTALTLGVLWFGLRLLLLPEPGAKPALPGDKS